jgi:hypothetical protein
MRQFLKEVWQTFSYASWKEISGRPAGKGLGFFSKVLLFAFIVLILVNIPALIRLPTEISQQLAKFEALRLSGNVTMTSPIKLPSSEPVVILDTSGAYTELTTERVLITRDRIFYRPLFKTHTLATEELKDLKQNRDQVKASLAMLVFFLLPSIVFYAYIAIWLKYFLMILALSIVLFILLDLTHWRRTWKELFVIACYVSTLPVLAEVIVGAIDANWLIPVLNIFGVVKLYLLPAVVLSVLTIGAVLCAYYETREKK